MPAGSAAIVYLRRLPLGTRVVVRRKESDGYRDALGYLVAIDDVNCTVETRQGGMTVPLASVVRAKTVPPPPAPRTPASGTPPSRPR